MDNQPKEGNKYDKIMRENLLEIFLPLIAHRLNFQIKSIQPLPDKKQTIDCFIQIT